MALDPRTPVIVAAAQYTQRVAEGDPLLEPADLMVETLRLAEADSGGKGLLAAAETVRHIRLSSARYGDPARLVAERMGANNVRQTGFATNGGQVVGTVGGTKYGYDKDGRPTLTKEPKLLLNDNDAGKVEGIHIVIGRRPSAAFGNTAGDRQMLEYTTAGDGARLGMLVLHDDAKREYAYGPADGLQDTRVGAFSQALYDEARKRG